MNFADPRAFLWVLAALPIVLFYILKVRLRRVPTSTNLFWNQLYDEKPPRSIWETLRHLLSLALQLAMLMLLVTAVADPYFSWQPGAARRVVLVVDNSASMQAADVPPTRLALAIGEGLRLADGLRFRDEMAVVVAAGAHPHVACGMSGHVPTLKAAIRGIQPADSPTGVQAAVELGKRLIGDHPHGQIVVLTDGCFPEAPSLAADPKVALRVFGTVAGNIGITQLQARRSLIDPLGYEILVSVRNASGARVHCRLEVDLDDSPVDVIPLELAPEETWTRSLEKTSLAGGRLVASLREIRRTDNDAAAPGTGSSGDLADRLAGDDRAWATVPPRKVQQVLLVSPGNLFLQKVFEANRLVQLRVSKTFPDDWSGFDLIVLHQQMPPKLPAGNVWAVDPENGCDEWQIEGDLENPLVTQQDAGSPLMTHVKLENVLLPKARKLTFRETPHVLAGALSGEPLYAEIRRRAGKLLVLTVDLDEGDLTFRTAFPIMVTNALGWFAGRAGDYDPALTTGTVSRVAIPSSASALIHDLRLRSPTGSLGALPVTEPAPPGGSDGKSSDAKSAPADGALSYAAVGPLDRCGLWSIIAGDNGQRGTDLNQEPLVTLCCNLANAAETDIRTPESLQAQAHEAPLASGILTRPLWYYLALLALLLTTTEWFLYQRRVIR